MPAGQPFFMLEKREKNVILLFLQYPGFPIKDLVRDSIPGGIKPESCDLFTTPIMSTLTSFTTAATTEHGTTPRCRRRAFHAKSNSHLTVAEQQP